MEIRNRKVNPHKKFRPESVEELEQDIAGKRAAIERDKEILTLKGHPGWEALCLNFIEELGEVETRLDRFDLYDEKSYPVLLQYRKDLKGFIGRLDDIERTIADLNEKISESLVELNERKQRVRATPN